MSHFAFVNLKAESLDATVSQLCIVGCSRLKTSSKPREKGSEPVGFGRETVGVSAVGQTMRNTL